MGKQLTKYYDYAKEQGGLLARMRLSMKTGLPPDKAAQVEDSPEVVDRFKRILSEILGAKVK